MLPRDVGAVAVRRLLEVVERPRHEGVVGDGSPVEIGAGARRRGRRATFAFRLYGHQRGRSEGFGRQSNPGLWHALRWLGWQGSGTAPPADRWYFFNRGGPQSGFGSVHRRGHLPTLSGFVALVSLFSTAVTVRAQSTTRPSLTTGSQLAAIAAEEDARGQAGLATTSRALRDPNPRIRAAAVRAVGRLQSTIHLNAIIGLLADPSPAVRLEAATALGQSLQQFRGSTADNSATISRAVDALTARATADPALRGVAARTLGRLPYADSAAARRGERAILAFLGNDQSAARIRAIPATTLEGVLHGLYGVARARRTLGAPSSDALAVMRHSVQYRGRGSADESAARVRRLAHLGVIAAGQASAEIVQSAIADSDEQVRRLAMTAQSQLPDTATRVSVVGRGSRDRSPMVRHEAARAWRAFSARDGCAPLIAAVNDDNPHVALAAIDGLSATCRDADRAGDALLNLIDAHRSDSPARATGRGGWHVHGHALVAAARTTPERARAIVRRDSDAGFWAVRVYAIRAATILRDTVTLQTAARDSNGNVREAALGGLAAVVGHGADSLFLAALTSPDYHVVLEAATALKGSSAGEALIEPLFAALERITEERRETSRDPRIALLERIGEAGGGRYAERLEPFRTDFDSTVAMRAAATLTQWTGQTVRAEPRPLDRPQETIEPLLAGEWRARVTMSAASGGGTFDVALFAREAPFTVARFVRLARAGYYNGLTFHRVEPGFVIQGGSPAATEYVGDGPFMRDELGAAQSYARHPWHFHPRARYRRRPALRQPDRQLPSRPRLHGVR